MISIVVPVYNEEEVLTPFIVSLLEAAKRWEDDYEIIFINDGSTDRTPIFLSELHRKYPNIKYVSFSRNFGHQVAVTAGLEYATGDAVIVMDGDLQDPPELLGEFISKWKLGYQVVYAVREKRASNLVMRMCYSAFYRLLACFSNIPIPLDSGDFCLMDRTVVEQINALPERNRFLRGLRSWVGYSQTGINYFRPDRFAGKTKYSLRKLFRLAADGLFSFSYRPLQMIGFIGVLISLASFLGVTVFVFLSAMDIKVLGHSPREAPGYTTLTFAVLFLGGIQLLSLGVLGEYVGRIFDEVKRRPSFIVDRAVGFEKKNIQPTIAKEDQNLN